MRAACGNCALWDRIARHGRATTTGYCTSPRVGGVTRDVDACRAHVPAAGRGFDENAAHHAFERFKAKQQPAGARAFDLRPSVRGVDTGALRARSAKQTGWQGGRRVA